MGCTEIGSGVAHGFWEAGGEWAAGLSVRWGVGCRAARGRETRHTNGDWRCSERSFSNNVLRASFPALTAVATVSK